MIDREPLDGRTNEYPLTDLGRQVLRTAVTLTAPLYEELSDQQ